MNYTNNGTARMSFLNAQQAIFDAWISSFNGNAKQCWDYIYSLKLAQNSVRVENTLTPTNTNYIFGLTPQQASTTGVKFRTEQRLNQQDTLIATEYSIGVGLTTGNDDANWEVQTYANPAIFGVADAALINGILFNNSIFKMTVNNDVVIPGRQLLENLYKPQTQQTAAIGAGSPMSQIRGAEDGFVTMEPNIYLIGSKNTVPEIILPVAMPTLVSTNVRLVITFRGLLAQNSTVVS